MITGRAIEHKLPSNATVTGPCLEMLGPRVVCVFEMGKAGHFKLYADKQNFILYMAK